MSRLAALAALTLVLTGCEQRDDRAASADQLGWSGKVKVWHDDQRSVTCWVFSGEGRGGIDCIPDHQLQAAPGAIPHQDIQPQAHHHPASPKAADHQAFQPGQEVFQL